MIDINLWRELSVFEKCATLSKVAEKLFISQPALRSMNKLEEEIGVIIFNRSKNKIIFLFLNLQKLYLFYMMVLLFPLKLMLKKNY